MTCPRGGRVTGADAEHNAGGIPLNERSRLLAPAAGRVEGRTMGDLPEVIEATYAVLGEAPCAC